MKTHACNHDHYKTGDDWGFTSPVYTYGVTDENRVAHGNIGRTDTCCDCGRQRNRLLNAGQEELSAWRFPAPKPAAKPATKAISGDELRRRADRYKVAVSRHTAMRDAANSQEGLRERLQRAELDAGQANGTARIDILNHITELKKRITC